MLRKFILSTAFVTLFAIPGFAEDMPAEEAPLAPDGAVESPSMPDVEAPAVKAPEMPEVEAPEVKAPEVKKHGYSRCRNA